MKIRLIISFLLFGILTSCAVFQSGIKQNTIKTESIFKKLLNENGNAFALTSTHVTFSRVWTYQTNKIKIYNIANGKITEVLNFENSDTNWIYLFSADNEMVFDMCLELDGDGLKFAIENNEFVNKNILPISIKCFVNIENKNEFYTQLSSDIIEYSLQLY